MTRRALAAALFVLATSAGAQDAPQAGFVFLDQERILTDSERGKALLADEEAARDALRAEARAVETAFEEEERRLTQQRATLDAAAFRALADDFDQRVEAARRDQDARASALAQEFEGRRRQFYADVAPLLVGVMEGRGAHAIFDETSVLLADQTLDITEAVIAEIDGPSEAAPAPPTGPEQGGGP